MRNSAVVLFAVVASSFGCGDCDREGCESVQQRTPERGTGIGGVVATSSDVVADGCQECGFQSGGAVAIWEVERVVSTPAAANQVLAAADPVRASVREGRFYAPLAPGRYLVCSAPNCINVTVAADTTTTVNVKLRNGPTSFFVVDPASRALVEDYGLDVGDAVTELQQ
jgi:hypothetical protein